MPQSFNHLNQNNDIHMVNISDKPTTHRTAIASAKVCLNQQTLDLVKQEKLNKGNVLNTARIAGILAAKQTSNLIPLCHPVPLTKINIDIEFIETTTSTQQGLKITATCQTNSKTGVEMEALTAVTHCALTIYDMCKVQQKDIVIDGILLEKKTGGKSGDWQR